MILNDQIFSQQSFDIFGSLGNFENLKFRLNSLESNASNFNYTNDWEFHLSSKLIFQNENNLNINMFSLSKRINEHYIYARYTPGIKQDFRFTSRIEFLVGDSIQSYKTNLSYKEKYGFGYSYKFSNNLTMGFNFRYFQQNFSEEYPTFYSDSVTQVIQIKEHIVNKNFWRGDVGVFYKLYENFNINMSTYNLIIAKDYIKTDDKSIFEINSKSFDIKQNKGVILGLNYYSKIINLHFNYESSHSFLINLNNNSILGKSFLTTGINIFHDKYQEPFFSGIMPTLNYSTNSFSITTSYLYYFNDRSVAKNLTDFRKYGIYNIQHNFFTPNQLNLLFNFVLSFTDEQQVKFLDLTILGDIYPTIIENYSDYPIAVAKVVNLTAKKIITKPSSFIKELNSEIIQSPMIEILPFDTVEVPFYTTMNNYLSNFDKRKISQAKFILSTDLDKVNDEIQKPILLNNKNNWDGNVSNLMYFISSDLDFANKYVMKIIDEYKDSIYNDNAELRIFNKIKILFNHFAKEMVYVSDRRASSDYVQFPRETLELKGGDCDDLSVCFGAMLESVGIQTAFIDYKPIESIGHVTVLVNTGLIPEQSKLISINDKKYFVRKNSAGKEEVWLPIEITDLSNFENAWNNGSAKFYKQAIDNLGLSKNEVEIIDIF